MKIGETIAEPVIELDGDSAPIAELLALNESFGVNFMIPENAQFATVIGAALHNVESL